MRPIILMALLPLAACASHGRGWDLDPEVLFIPKGIIEFSNPEANHCFSDGTGATICEYREPESATPPVLPPNVIQHKSRTRQNG